MKRTYKGIKFLCYFCYIRNLSRTWVKNIWILGWYHYISSRNLFLCFSLSLLILSLLISLTTYLFLYLSLSLLISFSTYLFLYLSLSLLISFSTYLFLYLSLSLLISFSTYLFLYLYLFLCLFISFLTYISFSFISYST